MSDQENRDDVDSILKAELHAAILKGTEHHLTEALRLKGLPTDADYIANHVFCKRRHGMKFSRYFHDGRLFLKITVKFDPDTNQLNIEGTRCAILGFAPSKHRHVIKFPIFPRWD